MSQFRNLTLEKYFDSSYMTLQQQVALFIKGFPLINMQQLSSLNTLVGLLIKQNSMLGQRFREQVQQIKENYKKSEQILSELRKRNLELQRQNKEALILIQQLRKDQNQSERMGASYLKQIEMLKDQIVVKKDNKQKNEQIFLSIKQVNQRFYAFCNDMSKGKFTKLYQSIKVGIQKFNQSLLHLSQLIIQSADSSKLKQKIKYCFEEVTESFSQKIKLQKSNNKADKERVNTLLSIIQQLHHTINQFSIKSKQTIRILQLTNHSIDTSNIFLKGFEGELIVLQNKVQSIKQKVPQKGRRSIETSVLLQSRKQRQSYQSILLKTIQILQKGNVKKDDSSKIRDSQQNLRNSFRDVEEKCKRELRQFSEYFKQGTTKLTQQLRMKEQMNQYYQKSLLQSRSKQQEFQRMVGQVSNSNLQLNRILLQKSGIILQMQQKVIQMKTVIQELQRKVIEVQKQKFYIQERLQESVLNIAAPLKQQLIRTRAESSDIHKKLLSDKQQLLITLSNQKKKTEQLMTNLLESKQDKSKLNQRIALQGQQVVELSKMLSLKDKQIDSLGQMIRQLETKVRCQSIDLRGKQFQLNDNQKKIKQLVNQNNQNMSHLKQIREELPIVIQLKNNLATSQQKQLDLSEQNLKLKMLLKQTKLQMINSRKAITELSSMANQYQQMKVVSSTSLGEVQKYRNKSSQLQNVFQRTRLTNQKLEKRVQQLQKYQIQSLTLQAQNNRLLIEVRHMKNVLGRITEIKQYI